MKNLYLKNIKPNEYNINKYDLDNKFIVKIYNDYNYFDLTDAIKVKFDKRTIDIYCVKYIPKKTDTWINLAYKFYKQPRLWYVIPIINKIYDIITTIPSDYNFLYILKSKYLYEIVK